MMMAFRYVSKKCCILLILSLDQGEAKRPFVGYGSERNFWFSYNIIHYSL